MNNSWHEYYSHYTDWDDSHCFNIRVEIRYEEELKKLGYTQIIKGDDFFQPEEIIPNTSMPKQITYNRLQNEILLSFDVPYDWSIDNDWEDRALLLLGIKEEWVIDSSVEDY